MQDILYTQHTVAPQDAGSSQSPHARDGAPTAIRQKSSNFMASIQSVASSESTVSSLSSVETFTRSEYTDWDRWSTCSTSASFRRRVIEASFPDKGELVKGLEEMYDDLLYFFTSDIHSEELQNWARDRLINQIDIGYSKKLSRALRRAPAEIRLQFLSILHAYGPLADLKQSSEFARPIVQSVVRHYLDAYATPSDEDCAGRLATMCAEWSTIEEDTRTLIHMLTETVGETFLLRLASRLRENAQILCWRGLDFVESELHYRNALIIYDLSQSPQEDDAAGVAFWLAETLRRQGRFAEAEHFHRRALDWRVLMLLPGHEQIRNAAFVLAEDLRGQQCFAEADEVLRAHAVGNRI